jgi:hypothetical protein
MAAPFLISILNTDESSVTRPVRFIIEETVLGTHWGRGCVVSTAGREKIFSRDSNPTVQHVSPSLYQLSFLGRLNVTLLSCLKFHCTLIWSAESLHKKCNELYFRSNPPAHPVIISRTDRIVALLCSTACTWSHEMVPSPSKQQLPACGAFRKRVSVVKGSCLRAAEIENVAVWAKGKRQALPKIRQIL